MQPSSAEEFGLFEEALSKRLLQFEVSLLSLTALLSLVGSHTPPSPCPAPQMPREDLSSLYDHDGDPAEKHWNSV